MSTLTIPSKRTGDTLSATEFNTVVDAINDNDSRITAISQAQDNINAENKKIQQNFATQAEKMNTLSAQNSTMSSDIATLQSNYQTINTNMVKMVSISQDDYDALVEAGTVDDDTYYNVFEQ